ncbi:mercury methylation corrinoid protein HgcA [Gemmatimonadota bacterium]
MTKRSHYITGEIATPAGSVPCVESGLFLRDRLETWKVRWRIGRMKYTVQPGLYAVGSPDSSSEVLVTANFKLTFDCVRSVLSGLDIWILVLDTKGINVWCAAGKGTFGTAELLHQIAATRLSEIVEHRRLLLPQLGAPGVAAHEVKKGSGFKVLYGPVLARDIPAFIAAGMEATPAMRRKRFPLSERVVLIPVELMGTLKYMIPAAAVFWFLSGFGGPGEYWSNVSTFGTLAVASLLASLLAGAVFVPLLLPWLPGRAFSLKGLWMGLIASGAALFWFGSGLTTLAGRLEAGSWLLMVTALSSFLGMNFTGASTYTSLSGVRKEMRTAVPLQIGAAAVGCILWLASRLMA